MDINLLANKTSSVGRKKLDITKADIKLGRNEKNDLTAKEVEAMVSQNAIPQNSVAKV